MQKVYYLVQEIAGPKNEVGILPPKEGGLGVAALNMLRAASQSLFNGVEFNLVLPGTKNVLRYFGAAKEVAGSETCGIVRSKMPYSGEPVLIIRDEKLSAIESFSKKVRQPDGFLYSDIVSKILVPSLNDGDILHLNGWHFYTVARAMKACLKNNPVILNVHIIRDVYRHEKDGMTINPWSEVIDASDILVPVSKTYAQQIVSGSNEPLSDEMCDQISQKNVYGIGNGYEKAEVYADVKQKAQEMAWIHRIDSRQKGLELLTEIVEDLTVSGSTWKLNILGNVDGADKEGQKFVKRIREIQSSHPGIVSIDTTYSAEKKDEILRRSKIFLCTSLYEGSPYAVMEAMNYGLVSVVTPKAGLLDLITNGSNGFVSPDMSVHGFRSALQKAFAACESRHYSDMVLHAQTSVPTPKAMFDSYREVYKACAEDFCAPKRYADIVKKLNRPHLPISQLAARANQKVID